MELRFKKPTKEIFLQDGESDGYEFKEVCFEVSDDKIRQFIYENGFEEELYYEYREEEENNDKF